MHKKKPVGVNLNRNLILGPESLIKLAVDSIDQETINKQLLTGRKASLSTHQKGKIVMKFL